MRKGVKKNKKRKQEWVRIVDGKGRRRDRKGNERI